MSNHLGQAGCAQVVVGAGCLCGHLPVDHVRQVDGDLRRLDAGEGCRWEEGETGVSQDSTILRRTKRAIIGCCLSRQRSERTIAMAQWVDSMQAACNCILVTRVAAPQNYRRCHSTIHGACLHASCSLCTGHRTQCVWRLHKATWPSAFVRSASRWGVRCQQPVPFASSRSCQSFACQLIQSITAQAQHSALWIVAA